MSTSSTWDVFLGYFEGSASGVFSGRYMEIPAEIPDALVRCEG